MAKTIAELRALMLTTSRLNMFDLPNVANTQIAASDINEELGRNPTVEFNIGGTEERALAEVPSGEISFSDFIGKSSYDKHNLTVGTDGASYGFNSIFGFGAFDPPVFQGGWTGTEPANRVFSVTPSNDTFQLGTTAAPEVGSTFEVIFPNFDNAWHILPVDFNAWASTITGIGDYLISENGNTVVMGIKFNPA